MTSRWLPKNRYVRKWTGNARLIQNSNWKKTNATICRRVPFFREISRRGARQRKTRDYIFFQPWQFTRELSCEFSWNGEYTSPLSWPWTVNVPLSSSNVFAPLSPWHFHQTNPFGRASSSTSGHDYCRDSRRYLFLPPSLAPLSIPLSLSSFIRKQDSMELGPSHGGRTTAVSTSIPYCHLSPLFLHPSPSLSASSLSRQFSTTHVFMFFRHLGFPKGTMFAVDIFVN